jgi:hypothetical protein
MTITTHIDTVFLSTWCLYISHSHVKWPATHCTLSAHLTRGTLIITLYYNATRSIIKRKWRYGFEKCIYFSKLVISSWNYILQSEHFYLLTAGAEDYCCTWSHSVTQTHTHTHIHIRMDSLDDGSVRRLEFYLHITQNSQETHIHTPSGIRTRNSKNTTSEFKTASYIARLSDTANYIS